MKKRAIKIVKQGTEAAAKPVVSAEEVSRQKKRNAAEDERDMIQSVKGWIDEREANIRTEGMVSESDRQAWEGSKPK
jgi:hypothetical protein